ncbi:mycofactocin precursor MftA [Nocardioides sp. WS12]|nr:mycofactocin precursor MftA [Nocardioides sp. WS12]
MTHTTEPAPQDAAADATDPIAAEDLIEEVSIDGMCGVY